MDIKGMLNAVERKDQAHASQLSPSQSKPPPLPTLNTGHSRSTPSDPYSASPTLSQYPFPQQPLQSPSFPQPYSARSNASGPQPGVPPQLPAHFSQASGQGSPYAQAHQQAPNVHTTHPQSPYAQTPGSQQNAILYPPPARPSLSRSPSASSYGQSHQYNHSNAASGRPYPPQYSPATGTGYPQQSPTSHSYGHSPPVTPLGPPQGSPSGSASYSNKSSPFVHEQRGNLSASSQPLYAHGPGSDIQTPSSQQPVSSLYNRNQHSPYDQSSTSRASREREKSMSVSPKTIVAPLPASRRSMSTGQEPSYQQHETNSSQSAYATEKATEMQNHSSAASGQTPQTINIESVDKTEKDCLISQGPVQSVESPAAHAPAHNLEATLVDSGRGGNTESPRSSASPSAQKKSLIKTATQPKPAKRPLETETRSTTSPAQRPPKRIKFKEPPIWAQRAKHNTPLPKDRSTAKLNGSAPIVTSAPAPGLAHPPTAQPEFMDNGPLGAFEPTFTNVIPFEELTRNISNFLFLQVVQNETLDTGQAGGVPSATGQLEIEAKIGTLIDKRTDERLRIPIQTEAVIVDALDVAFESLMTEAQHRAFNEFLNKAVEQCHMPPAARSDKHKPSKPRIKMHTVHRYETDTFFELPTDEVSALPPAVRAVLHPSHKPRLRVTRDQKTGKVLAKVVKLRIKDLHVYSPMTVFDWRVSVSLEMDWTGDLEQFMRTARQNATHQLHERHKNRMSYRHLFNQIDLTQVKDQNKGEPIHELEIELDSSEVRRQGKLAMEGKENQYEDLIKSFSDNVRILVRAVGAV